MKNSVGERSSRPVAIWLLVGVAMIIVQILLGGITRLTGSGLSITEWKPIMGALPPMNEEEWSIAFGKYQQIAQYKVLNSHFTLSDFKFIFFWEWLHRLWARLIAVAFIIPFIVFLIQRRFKKKMINPLTILLLLGVLQGLVGWIMVKSGLEDSENIYVSHYKLAIHFILALGLLCYTLWFALQLLVPQEQIFTSNPLRRFINFMIVVLILQLIYGAFMAGLKAAPAAPTWPDMNGGWLPFPVQSFGGREFPGISFLWDNPVVVQFIHRNLGYIITLAAFSWWWKTKKFTGSLLFRRTRSWPVIIVTVQLLLGILTVLNVTHPRAFLWLAIAHQTGAMLLLLSWVWMLFIVRKAGT
jgi:heme a synthase